MRISDWSSDVCSSDLIEEFIAFSLSVQHRRKSRVGYSLEHHMEVVFKTQNIRYKRTATTENKSKPAFLLPGQEENYAPAFNHLLLTLIDVKSTCQDRERHVMYESDKSNVTHILQHEHPI